MIKLRTDLPIKHDAAAGFIPWLVAIMVFLGSLATSGYAVFDGALHGWTRAMTGTLTVQIPPLTGSDADRGRSDPRIARVLDVLATSEAVAEARALDRSEIERLLEPWLGDDGSQTLPLPALIDVSLAKSDDQAVADIIAGVAATVPGAVVDDHRTWFQRLVGLARALRTLSLAVVGVVIAALALTVIFATRASLSAFRDVIEVLHLVGAPDGYVALQFARRTLILSLQGAVAGLAFTLIAVGVIAWLGARIDPTALPAIDLGLLYWAGVILLPVVAIAIATVTAFVTVLSTLRSFI